MKSYQTFRYLSTVVAAATSYVMMVSADAQTAPQQADPDDDSAILIDLTAKPGGLNAAQGNGNTTEAGQPGELENKENQPDQDEAEVVGQQTADEGIQIQVERSTGKSGVTNQPGSVKVYSPWPAKPLSAAPAGWKFAPAPAGIRPFKTSAKLGSGNTVDLSITPFVLVPVSDGLNAIRIAEPGYDPAQKYSQKNTIGTMLQQSTQEIENNEKQAADAIMRLQQLLSSLPQK